MIDFEASLDVTPTLLGLKRLAGRWTDFTPVFGGRVDVLARALVRKQFLTEGRAGAGGGGWAALKDSTIKRREFKNRPILRQHDALFNALTKRDDENQETVLEADQYSLTVSEGSEVYERFIDHTFGTKHMVAREPIPDPLPKTFIDEVRRAVKRYVVTGKA